MTAIVVDEPNRLRVVEEAAPGRPGPNEARLRVLCAESVGADVTIDSSREVVPTRVAARDAFDRIERRPERTAKVHLDLAG